MAWRVVGWYRQRWHIEQFFRTLKQQGLQPEDSQLENAGRSIKLTAIAARAACTIMQRVQARDGRSGQDASIAFSPPEIETLHALLPEPEGKTALQKTPHPPQTPGLGRVDHRRARWMGWLPKIQTTRPDHLPPRSPILQIPRPRMEARKCVNRMAEKRGSFAFRGGMSPADGNKFRPEAAVEPGVSTAARHARAASQYTNARRAAGTAPRPPPSLAWPRFAWQAGPCSRGNAAGLGGLTCMVLTALGRTLNSVGDVLSQIPKQRGVARPRSMPHNLSQGRQADRDDAETGHASTIRLQDQACKRCAGHNHCSPFRGGTDQKHVPANSRSKALEPESTVLTKTSGHDFPLRDRQVLSAIMYTGPFAGKTALHDYIR